ncbi:MAG: transporter [Elusimicrobia bacterium]|nr:transporter [Elusimicrobiota bacterium]
MKRMMLLGVILMMAGPLQAAPISFNTALPVHEGGFLFRGETVWMRLHDDPSPMGREMDVVAVPSVLVYGVTSKLALMGVIPYMDKRLDIKSMGATREASGLGDIMSIAREEIYQWNGAGRTVRGALFGGVQWPTGRSKESDGAGLLPKPVQLGSGSYNPIAGTVWTMQWLSAEVDADFSYQRKTWANDFKFGDVIMQDVSLQYRLWPWTLEAEGVPGYFYGVLEANNFYRFKDEASGIKDNNSGGYQLFLTPGVQWVTKRVVLEAAAQLPAVQELNGQSLKTDYQLIGSIRVWF